MSPVTHEAEEPARGECVPAEPCASTLPLVLENVSATELTVSESSWGGDTQQEHKALWHRNVCEAPEQNPAHGRQHGLASSLLPRPPPPPRLLVLERTAGSSRLCVWRARTHFWCATVTFRSTLEPAGEAARQPSLLSGAPRPPNPTQVLTVIIGCLALSTEPCVLVCPPVVLPGTGAPLPSRENPHPVTAVQGTVGCT